MIRGRLVLGVVVASVALVTAAPPACADDELGLSRDGTTWHETLRLPLFGGPGRWVPGDVGTRSFYVRNEGPSGARLIVALVARDRDRLVSDDDLTLSARAAGGPWTPLRIGQDVTSLVRHPLGQGETARIDVRASFRWSSTNQSMTDGLPLTIVVELRQDGPVDGDVDADPDLPGVGSPVPLWLVGAALASIGSGVLVLVVRRRRARGDG